MYKCSSTRPGYINEAIDIYIQTTQVIAFLRDPGYKKSFKNTTSVVVRVIVFYDILKYAYPLQCFVICSINAFIAKGAYQKATK